MNRTGNNTAGCAAAHVGGAPGSVRSAGPWAGVAATMQHQAAAGRRYSSAPTWQYTQRWSLSTERRRDTHLEQASCRGAAVSSAEV